MGVTGLFASVMIYQYLVAVTRTPADHLNYAGIGRVKRRAGLIADINRIVIPVIILGDAVAFRRPIHLIAGYRSDIRRFYQVFDGREAGIGFRGALDIGRFLPARNE